MKTKTFDAVIESRKWKAEVSEKTQSMSREQVLAFFDKDKALASLAQMRQSSLTRSKNAV
jgi:hypothetical protein